MLVRVTAPHFCAGIEFRDEVATLAAPILKWVIGKRRDEFERYCARKGWTTETVRPMTTHLMTDIETLGTRPGAVVISAAFVRCHDEAHMVLNLSIPEQVALGMEIDPKTHAWWGEQEAKEPGIWARVTENPQPLSVALPYISQWIQWAAGGSDFLIWCHGATFDCPILDELYRRAGLPSPWSYWQVQCTRTAYNLAGINPKEFAVPPPHVALNDALGQSRALMAALKVLARAHLHAA